MRNPIRRIRAWIAGVHAWYYLGGPIEETLTPIDGPTRITKRERKALMTTLGMMSPRERSEWLHSMRCYQPEEGNFSQTLAGLPDTEEYNRALGAAYDRETGLRIRKLSVLDASSVPGEPWKHGNYGVQG